MTRYYVVQDKNDPYTVFDVKDYRKSEYTAIVVSFWVWFDDDMNAVEQRAIEYCDFLNSKEQSE